MKNDTSEQCVIMAVINCTKIKLPVKYNIKPYRNTFQMLFEHWFILIKRNKRNIWSMLIVIKSWCARSHLSCVNVRFVYVL